LIRLITFSMPVGAVPGARAWYGTHRPSGVEMTLE
jgi:hypothetical protein